MTRPLVALALGQLQLAVLELQLVHTMLASAFAGGPDGERSSLSAQAAIERCTAHLADVKASVRAIAALPTSAAPTPQPGSIVLDLDDFRDPEKKK